MSSEKSKLVAAAEALVQAAIIETNSSSLAISREVATGIKDISLDLKAVKGNAKILVSIDASVTTLKSKVDTLNSNICTMQTTMSSIDASLKTQEKLHRIEFALGQCNYGSFQYFSDGSYKQSDAFSTHW